MFTDQNLQHTFEKGQKTINEHTRKLDECSKDIKNFEKLLKSAAISEGVGVIIKNKTQDGFLSWNGDRIVWKKYNSAIENTLFECKWPIRLELREYFPELLEKCLNSIREEKEND